MSKPRTDVVVGISGCSGSGKTTLAAILHEVFHMALERDAPATVTVRRAEEEGSAAPTVATLSADDCFRDKAACPTVVVKPRSEADRAVMAVLPRRVVAVACTRVSSRPGEEEEDDGGVAYEVRDTDCAAGVDFGRLAGMLDACGFCGPAEGDANRGAGADAGAGAGADAGAGHTPRGPQGPAAAAAGVRAWDEPGRMRREEKARAEALSKLRGPTFDRAVERVEAVSRLQQARNAECKFEGVLFPSSPATATAATTTTAAATYRIAFVEGFLLYPPPAPLDWALDREEEVRTGGSERYPNEREPSAAAAAAADRPGPGGGIAGAGVAARTKSNKSKWVDDAIRTGPGPPPPWEWLGVTAEQNHTRN